MQMACFAMEMKYFHPKTDLSLFGVGKNKEKGQKVFSEKLLIQSGNSMFFIQANQYLTVVIQNNDIFFHRIQQYIFLNHLFSMKLKQTREAAEYSICMFPSSPNTNKTNRSKPRLQNTLHAGKPASCKECYRTGGVSDSEPFSVYGEF